MTAAAAGLGIPTKYRLSLTIAVVLWTLKRASRIAAAVTKRKPTAHPSRFERPQSPRERENRGREAERHDVGQRVELDAERG